MHIDAKDAEARDAAAAQDAAALNVVGANLHLLLKNEALMPKWFEHGKAILYGHKQGVSQDFLTYQDLS